jgi:hypothetical protein
VGAHIHTGGAAVESVSPYFPDLPGHGNEVLREVLQASCDVELARTDESTGRACIDASGALAADREIRRSGCAILFEGSSRKVQLQVGERLSNHEKGAHVFVYEYTILTYRGEARSRAENLFRNRGVVRVQFRPDPDAQGFLEPGQDVSDPEGEKTVVVSPGVPCNLAIAHLVRVVLVGEVVLGRDDNAASPGTLASIGVGEPCLLLSPPVRRRNEALLQPAQGLFQGCLQVEQGQHGNCIDPLTKLLHKLHQFSG